MEEELLEIGLFGYEVSYGVTGNRLDEGVGFADEPAAQDLAVDGQVRHSVDADELVRVDV